LLERAGRDCDCLLLGARDAGEICDRDGKMKLPFGKYRGIDLCFVNSGYLKWLIDQDWFVMERPEAEVIAVEKELESRDMDNSHFWKDKVKV